MLTRYQQSSFLKDSSLFVDGIGPGTQQELHSSNVVHVTNGVVLNGEKEWAASLPLSGKGGRTGVYYEVRYVIIVQWGRPWAHCVKWNKHMQKGTHSLSHL